MDQITNLRDLLIEEGRELYSANEQELQELPIIELQISSSELKQLIQEQMHKSRAQLEQLTQAMVALKADFQGGWCETTQAILKHLQQLINSSLRKEVRDAGIISALQQLSHRKIAGLGTITSYARAIGQIEAAKILHKTLDEEKNMDQKFSHTAEGRVNRWAVGALTM